MPYSTTERIFTLETPLGEDELLISGFEGSERLSRPFHFKLTMQSERDDIAPDELVGKRVALRVQTADDERHWTGVVSTFTRLATRQVAGSSRDTMTIYRCEVVPWIWMLLLNEDSRIFQNLSIPDIVEQIFADFQYDDYELQLNQIYEPLVYCTQYRETSFAFIARLLERAGIWYWFRHEADTETLVLTDSPEGSPDLEIASIRFGLPGSYQQGDMISAFDRRERIRSGRFVLRSYDFEKPTADLEARVESLVRIGDNAGFERYIHPGGYVDRGDGERIARLLMEAEEADHATIDGASDARLLTPGYSFELEEHPDEALNAKYVIVAVEHRGNNNLDGDDSSSYANTFSVIPRDVPFREPQLTRKPRIDGVQTAVVTGPAGEETYTDEHGRVKIHLMWDRWGTADDKASCWARVMQGWAGNGWGSFVLPRIGMEVVVAFENGDPDHPLVIGCVYNGANKPPYALPGEATKSTFKTYSSKGGGGFNELRFEDKKDAEQIFVNAQKDIDVRVGHDSREWVERDSSLIVKRDHLEEAQRSRHAHVTKDLVVDVGGDDNLTVTGKQAIRIQGSRSLKVDGSVGESFQDHSEQVATNHYLNAGANVVVEAGAMITLKVGANYITVSPAGIAIVGSIVLINSGGPQAPGNANSLVPPMAFMAPAVADTADPGQKTEVSMQHGENKGRPPPDAPMHDPQQNKDKTHRIEVELRDEAGQPVPGETVEVVLPDGETVACGTTNEKGLFKVEHIDAGNCTITFPDLDENAWEEA